MVERQKSPQKSGRKPEKGKKTTENRKKKCAGNQKMTFFES